MKKYFIIGIVLIIAIASGIYMFKDNIFPYKGELIASKGIYHREDCKLLKYSSDKEVKMYNNFVWAVKSGNRPCFTCNPPYYTPNELKRVEAEKKIRDVKMAKYNEILPKRIEECKTRILKSNYQELTFEEKRWRDDYLYSQAVLRHLLGWKLEKPIQDKLKNELDIKD